MRLSIESEEAQKIVVFLNDKPVNHFICAEDGVNGWIEVVDPEAMAPLYENQGNPWAELQNESSQEGEEEAWVPLKTKKITGKVEFRRLG